MIDENYLVYGHTLKHAKDASLIFFFPGYVNEIPLPNLGFHLYKCRSLTFELQPVETPRRSSVSGRMTQSMSRNAAKDMPPPPPPHAFHGYASTWAQHANVAGSSSGYQPSRDQYIPQPEAGASSWQSASSADWEQPVWTNWAMVEAPVRVGRPPLFAERHSF